jgi:hypothetical protein
MRLDGKVAIVTGAVRYRRGGAERFVADRGVRVYPGTAAEWGITRQRRLCHWDRVMGHALQDVSNRHRLDSIVRAALYFGRGRMFRDQCWH